MRLAIVAAVLAALTGCGGGAIECRYLGWVVYAEPPVDGVKPAGWTKPGRAAKDEPEVFTDSQIDHKYAINPNYRADRQLPGTRWWFRVTTEGGRGIPYGTYSVEGTVKKIDVADQKVWVVHTVFVERRVEKPKPFNHDPLPPGKEYAPH